VAVAKKNLLPGDVLDVFGGYTFRGLLKEKSEAMAENALPAALAPGASVIKAVKKGSVVSWADVSLDEASALVRLRREQDAEW
jgi:predicted homoserine dehydrogenase-like protein